jgi:3-oxoacyl-[acyl-carrier protein] reductase
MATVLIFGAKGSIGNYLYNKFKLTYKTIGTTHSVSKMDDNFIYVDNQNVDALKTIPSIDIVVWASGDNCNDNIIDFDNNIFDSIFEANVKFILNTLHFLLKYEKINKSAKMVIISSIWEEITRGNKLSYTITKSALSGLVKNIAFDLSHLNVLVNNVLPGVINNEMTTKSLSTEQIEKVSNSMNFHRLITLEDVYNTIKFLVVENTGITGQSIKVDLGFTHIKNI